MKIELMITGDDFDSQHKGDWDFTITHDGVPVAGGGADTLAKAVALAVGAAQTVLSNAGKGG